MGDRCNSDFFTLHSQQHRKVYIRELNNNGKIRTRQPDMASYVQDFYKTLYTRDEAVRTMCRAVKPALRVFQE
jgi:hypothetical protein